MSAIDFLEPILVLSASLALVAAFRLAVAIVERQIAAKTEALLSAFENKLKKGKSCDASASET
ncbi:MAG: hypothetical protein N2515_01300 [Deltaproteobacteria bacterium]|nr:hypothetical protein [Sandaracinaceae bacterium]MCX7807219.1 hypothetical protein [Deltaproteobacteria bacterium]MDW8246009.1 hypothetical protein [Sandaracinaceae bacterium]